MFCPGEGIEHPAALPIEIDEPPVIVALRRRVPGKSESAGTRRRGGLRVPGKRRYRPIGECEADLRLGFVLAACFRSADVRDQLSQIQPFCALTLRFGNVGYDTLR